MKSTKVFLAVGVLFGVVGLWGWLSPERPSSAPGSSTRAPVETPDAGGGVSGVMGREVGVRGVTPAVALPEAENAIAAEPERQTDAVPEADLRQIETLMATYAAPALPKLAVFLRHADSRVRAAAREGVVQLGLTEGAAVLRAAADETKDPREALELLDAAEFLELPPVNALTPEFIERRAQERERAKTNTAPR